MEYESRISRGIDILAKIPVLGTPFFLRNAYVSFNAPIDSSDRKKFWQEYFYQAFSGADLFLAGAIFYILQNHP